MTAYRTIASEADVEALAASGAAWLLKHSNACSISHAAFAVFSDHVAAHPDQPAGLLVIQDYRPLAGWIATRFGRVHQSPQLFLIKGGAAVWQATHWSITAEAMDQAWRAHAVPTKS